MKKSTKLLSVLLTVLMIFSSVSVGAFAAKTSYQTADNLTALNAYSPYGTVTRLSTEERMSIVFDSLDLLLAPMQSLNMGYLLNVNLLITKLQLYVNLTSVDELCATLDSAAALLCGGWGTIAKGILNLGILEDVKLNTWNNTYKGIRRGDNGNSNLKIVQGLADTLDDNTALIETVFTDGISLGMILNFLPAGTDMSGINVLVKDLPKLVNGIVLPLFSRQDDKAAQRQILENRESNLINVAQSFINGIFNKKMGWTSYRVDASGNSIGATDALPTSANGTTRYFAISNDKKTITQYDYKYAGVLGGDPAGYYETVTYTKSDTEEITGSGVYLYNAPADYEGDRTLKWYKADNYVDANGRKQSGYWLPSVAGHVGTDITLNINGNDSVAGLLYKWAPVIFAELAPTVLNGSVKKLIAGAFDVQFTKIGVKGDSAVAAVAAATGNPDNFFTKEQEYYTWEYSDYKVINGTPYYRFQDEYFVGDVPKNISTFYNMINWDYHISGDFMNKYIPATVGGTSQAGYTRVLEALNTFVYDLIQEFIMPSWDCKGTTVYRSDVFAWTQGGNEKIVDNVRAVATNVFNLAPEEIVDEYYDQAQFYNAMMNGTNAQAVNGLICAAVQLLMPQIKFADNIVEQPMLAIAAAVVRELCSQLMPKYNFDAMIFSDYNNRTMLAGKDSDYWLNTVLYMGVNLGMFYLRNLADLGEDDNTNGYYGVMKTLHALPEDASADGITFGALAQYVGNTETNADASWLRMVDWVIDWALTSEVEWAWKFEKFIDCGSTVKLSTYQNPFNKLDTVLFTKLLPAAKDLLNVSAFNSTTYGSGTFLEKVLKNGLVDSITTLNVPQLIGVLAVPTNGVFCKNNIADELVKIIVNLLNTVFYKIAGNTNVVTGITSVTTLLNHTNLKNVVKTLVGKLGTAYNNGLLDPVLPIANFFIGWTVDPQKYAEPDIYFSNDWNSSYLYKENVPVIKITNKSSGMLLKHRTVDGGLANPDGAYNIQITGITLDNGVSTSQTFPVPVAPGGTASISLTVPATEAVTRATITYKFFGKDGQPIGGTQTKVAYAYVSNVTDQLNENVSGTNKKYTINNDYKSFEFTKDVYDTITNYTATVSYKREDVFAIGPPSSCSPESFTHNSQPTGVAAQYFEFYGTNQTAQAGFVTVYREPNEANGKPASSTGHLYRAKSGVTAATNFPYGVYDMGNVAIKYNGSGKDYIVDFIYYNDFDIGTVRDKYLGMGLKASDFSGAAADAFNTYDAALRKVVKLANIAMRTDYVTTIQPQIEAAIAALDAAYEELLAFGKVQHQGDVAKVQETLEGLENLRDANGNQRDINFQDYDLFEYFQYEKQRTSARQMIKATKAPEAPQKYVENSVWGTNLINAIDTLYSSETAVRALYADDDARKTALTADYVANVKKGIDAKVIAPTAGEMTDWQNACNDFVPATYTLLQTEDQEQKLNYYYNFMTARAKEADKTFLNKEIAYAEAQNYAAKHAAEPYSTDSWSRYTDALAKAKTVAAKANANGSEVFDAKYELMAAQNALLLASHSMKDCGYLDRELNTVIAQANNILDYYKSNGTGYYKLADGVTEDEALGQLVWALGIYYKVTADGIKQDGYVFDRSAATFAAYDRVNSVKNMRAVDLVADHLREAIANFKIDVKVTASDTTAVQDIDQEVRFIQGIKPGSIDSIDTLLTKVTSSAGTLVGAANVDGHFGTGATVTVKIGDVDVTKYIVVIYGDVNGDGAVDGFDLFDVNKHNNRLMTLLNIYETAGDIDGNGKVDLEDYSAIKLELEGGTAIDQTHSA